MYKPCEYRRDVEASWSWQFHCTTDRAQSLTIASMLSMERHLGELASRVLSVAIGGFLR